MKKLLVSILAAGGLASAAYAAAVYVASNEIQSTTRDSPIVDAPTASEKISLTGVKKIRATACTCSTSACTARDAYPMTGGRFDVWYQHPDAGWSENPFLRLPAGGIDGGCMTWADIESPGANIGGATKGGHMMISAQGVTKTYADAGAYVRVMLEGITNE